MQSIDEKKKYSSGRLESYLRANITYFGRLSASPTKPIALCYTEAFFKNRCEVIFAFSERPYHHIFLCEPDFQLVQDGTRKDEEFRTWQHSWYQKELAKMGAAFILLTGDIHQRLTKIYSEINWMVRAHKNNQIKKKLGLYPHFFWQQISSGIGFNRKILVTDFGRFWIWLFNPSIIELCLLRTIKLQRFYI